jgi:hypothetical protein
MSRRISRTHAYVPPVSSDKTAQKLLREHLPWVPAPLYGLITYYRFLFCYMAALSFLGSFIIYGLERESCSYTSAAFTAVSAVTQTGLIVLDTSALRGGTQAVNRALLQPRAGQAHDAGRDGLRGAPHAALRPLLALRALGSHRRHRVLGL